MKKTIIAISMLTMSLNAVAQVVQDDTGAGAAGSFSKPTMSLSNLPWATEQAMNEIAFDPTVSVTAPTLTTMIASYRDSELNKIVYAAKDDAATFVATDGETKGAFFQAAVNMTRKLTGTSKSDMALAYEVIAVTSAVK